MYKNPPKRLSRLLLKFEALVLSKTNKKFCKVCFCLREIENCLVVVLIMKVMSIFYVLVGFA